MSAQSLLIDTVGTGSGKVGRITLNRPVALNALDLPMVRGIAAALAGWAADESVVGVVMRGSAKDAAAPHFGHFCAGGDIRFFHRAALAGDPALEDFFTEEYALNHQISVFPKPMLWLLDGVVMGGGMGLCAHDPVGSMRGAASPGGVRYRLGTERVQMAMPETLIGLFPDVGGGWFLARSPGALGEYLALVGPNLNRAQSAAVGWLDGGLPSAQLHALWAELTSASFASSAEFTQWASSKSVAIDVTNTRAEDGFLSKTALIDEIFALPTVQSMVKALEALPDDAFAAATAQALRKRSPLMLEVTLSQIRRARSMSLADALRMERDMVRHSFHNAHLGRSGAATDTAEGIRALAVDKDHAPKWQPERLEDVRTEMVEPFFASPWPAAMHPLRAL